MKERLIKVIVGIVICIIVAVLIVVSYLMIADIETKFIPSETNDLSKYGLKLNIAIYFELSDSVEDTSDYNIKRYI